LKWKASLLPEEKCVLEKKKKQCTYILLALGKELKIMDSRAGM
jgi:hypothetical protein